MGLVRFSVWEAGRYGTVMLSASTLAQCAPPFRHARFHARRRGSSAHRAPDC
jgi:hypothetical protein